MTKMTRKFTRRGRIGHFEISGYMQLKHNYEFGSLLYGGMLGLSIRRGVDNINLSKVQEAYRQLCQTNPPLLHYLQDISKAENVIQYHIQENKPYVQLRPTWRDNILMPTQDVAPMAAQLPIHDLPIGNNSLNRYFPQQPITQLCRHSRFLCCFTLSSKPNGTAIPLAIHQRQRPLFPRTKRCSR
jgi:hypothetical protein